MTTGQNNKKADTEFSPRIAIIGAGFSGIGMAIRLQQQGYTNFTLYERSNSIGGTWRDNTYPGCACDVASHLYSFSFFQNPDWSHVFSEAREIYQYLQACVKQFNLDQHIAFNTEISQMRYEADAHQWRITTSDHVSIDADILINGTGPLNKPLIPNIQGLNTFTGKVFHSSNWDHEYALAGKQVACIGTGASAIQFIPKIVHKAASVKVFQRSPTWLVPRFNRAYSGFTQAMFKHFRILQHSYRLFLYWRNEYYGIGIMGLPIFNTLLQKASQLFLYSKVKDPVLRKKLSPDYQFGCKRINISDDYYAALQQPNTQLITEGIQAVDSKGIITADGAHHACDAIIFGTGFVTQEHLQPMKIFGLNDVELTQAWNGAAKTYLGISVAGFPNHFLLLGPNTGLGHNSVIFMIEAQIDYVLSALNCLKQSRGSSLDVKADTQQAFCAATQKKLKNLSWGSGCKSWYLSKNGENYSIWPGLSASYWLRTRQFNRRNYHIVYK